MYYIIGLLYFVIALIFLGFHLESDKAIKYDLQSGDIDGDRFVQTICSYIISFTFPLYILIALSIKVGQKIYLLINKKSKDFSIHEKEIEDYLNPFAKLDKNNMLYEEQEKQQKFLKEISSN